MTTYRMRNVSDLEILSANLLAKGFVVSRVVVPEIPAVGGNPYITTSATCLEIMLTLRHGA
jgi:hypothetical protein